jgi:pyroglutamyl-peptidase
VLVTGFEPFDGGTVNPSQRIAEALAGEVATAVLPVSYARVEDSIEQAMSRALPDVVICFGQADGRPGISVERFAHNVDEASKPDNDGEERSGAPIDPGGPPAYASTLPVDGIVAALREERIPASASRDAGGFICNRVFYVLMRLLEERGGGAIGGFVHVPLLPEQALESPAASMPLDTLVRAARIVIGASS